MGIDKRYRLLFKIDNQLVVIKKYFNHIISKGMNFDLVLKAKI